MLRVRTLAKNLGFEVIGKLARAREWEQDRYDRWYIDDAGNEYYVRHGVLSIITADGGVI